MRRLQMLSVNGRQLMRSLGFEYFGTFNDAKEGPMEMWGQLEWGVSIHLLVSEIKINYKESILKMTIDEFAAALTTNLHEYILKRERESLSLNHINQDQILDLEGSP